MNTLYIACTLILTNMTTQGFCGFKKDKFIFEKYFENTKYHGTYPRNKCKIIKSAAHYITVKCDPKN